MSGGRRPGENEGLAALARSTTSGDVRRPRHARDPEETYGAVRRLDSGPRPDRHPAVRWPDERRPHAQRVDNASTPVAEAIRHRLHDAPREALDPRVRPQREAPVARRDAVLVTGRARLAAPPRSHAQGERRESVGESVEANARLTGSTAAVLLVLLAIEGLTLLQIQPLLSVHVFVGMLLIPPVLVKIGSTTWRFAKYYLGDPEYRRKGPPAPLLRLLGPALVVLTALVLASGVALLLASSPSSLRTELLFVHKASFVLWFIVMTVHVLGHFLDTAKLAPRDWYWRTRRQIAGANRRQWLLASAVVLGVLVGAVMLPHVGAWLAGLHRPLSGVHHR